MCRKFLWAGSKPKVAWKSICSPKDEGGLGLRDCSTWNLATLYKILWDIHSRKNILWIKWIHTYYLRGRDVWTWTCNAADHPLFNRVHKLREHIIVSTGSIQQAMQKLGSCKKGGKFCSSLVYEWMRPKYEKKPWMTLIWHRYIPPKFSFILWLLFRGKLNTKDHWLIETEDMNCVFCKNVMETIPHLFFRCSFVKAVWYRIWCWLHIQRHMTSLLSSIKWIKKDYGGAFIHNKVVVLAFLATVYTIWITRNKMLFLGYQASTKEITKMIKTMVLTIIHANYPSDSLYI